MHCAVSTKVDKSLKYKALKANTSNHTESHPLLSQVLSHILLNFGLLHLESLLRLRGEPSYSLWDYGQGRTSHANIFMKNLQRSSIIYLLKGLLLYFDRCMGSLNKAYKANTLHCTNARNRGQRTGSQGLPSQNQEPVGMILTMY
jgi:hypothetical protein